MNKTPKLTSEQQKRFCHWLVKQGQYPSYQKARRATDSHIKTHRVFLQVINFYDDSETQEIEDIVLAYVIDDDIQANCGSNLMKDSPNRTHNKVNQLENVANQTHNKVRGKQKSPTMQHYKIRLPVDTLDRLKALDGIVSEHIRQAIDNYLNTKQAN